MRHYRGAIGAADVKNQSVAGNAQMQLEGTGPAVHRRKSVVLDQVVNCDRTLMLDVGPRAADRIFIEHHPDETGGFSVGAALRAGHFGLKRIATERACASSPSASASAIAAGPSARSWSDPHLRIEVRFMKSSTPSPDEKRAERAVGSTWL